jgi:isocitrate dehydrogenase
VHWFACQIMSATLSTLRNLGVGWQLQVTPNLYGTLVANTAAGIAGGTGVMPGGIEAFLSTLLHFSSA